MTDPVVALDEEASRYEIRLGDTLVGFAEFERRSGEIRFTHTEIDPAFQGRGLARVLADHALADAAASGDTIVPICPFMAKHLRRNEIDVAVIRWPDAPGDESPGDR